MVAASACLLCRRRHGCGCTPDGEHTEHNRRRRSRDHSRSRSRITTRRPTTRRCWCPWRWQRRSGGGACTTKAWPPRVVGVAIFPQGVLAWYPAAQRVHLLRPPVHRLRDSGTEAPHRMRVSTPACCGGALPPVRGWQGRSSCCAAWLLRHTACATYTTYTHAWCRCRLGSRRCADPQRSGLGGTLCDGDGWNRWQHA